MVRLSTLAALAGGVVGSLFLVACGGTAAGVVVDPGVTTFRPPLPPTPWTVDAGGTGTTSAVGVGAFSDGSVMMTGAFDQDVVLGRGTPTETALPGTGSSCVFVSRYESDGSLRWARAARGIGYVAAYGTAVLADDSIVVAGYFSKTASFDDGLGGATAVTSLGSEAGFLAKYSGDGTLVWVRSIDSAGGYAEALPVAALADGSIAVAGLFLGTMDLGAGEPNETLLSSAYLEAFVARYAPDGSLLWARSTSTPGGYATAWAMAGTSDLGVVVAGEVNGTAIFGSGEPKVTPVTSEVGTDDVWIARFGANGDFVWARRIGGAQEDEVYSVAVAPDGSIRVGGYFRDATVVDADGLAPQSLIGHGALDAYVVALGADGAALWGHAMGGTEDDFTVCVAVATDGSTVVTGGFHGPADFDGSGPTLPLVLNDTVATGFDAFVARYGQAGELLWARAAGGLADDFGIAVSVNEANGSLLVGGSYSGAATIGTTLTATGPTDAFLALFSLAGTP